MKEISQGPWNDGFDVGAMTMRSSLESIKSILNRAQEEGARVVVGGKENELYEGQVSSNHLLASI